jgi:hypothetical protein
MSGHTPWSQIKHKRGSMKPGPSEDYKALLRGEITPEEYVERLKARVDERFEQERRYKRVQPWWKEMLRRD